MTFALLLWHYGRRRETPVTAGLCVHLFLSVKMTSQSPLSGLHLRGQFSEELGHNIRAEAWQPKMYPQTHILNPARLPQYYKGCSEHQACNLDHIQHSPDRACVRQREILATTRG